MKTGRKRRRNRGIARYERLRLWMSVLAIAAIAVFLKARLAHGALLNPGSCDPPAATETLRITYPMGLSSIGCFYCKNLINLMRRDTNALGKLLSDR